MAFGYEKVASFEKDFGKVFSRRSGFLGGGISFQSGRYSLLQKIRAGLGDEVVPVLEGEDIRLLPSEKAVEFWAAWAKGRR